MSCRGGGDGAVGEAAMALFGLLEQKPLNSSNLALLQNSCNSFAVESRISLESELTEWAKMPWNRRIYVLRSHTNLLYKPNGVPENFPFLC